MNVAVLTYWALAAVAAAGAAVVVFTRDVMRLVLGLGAFLLAVAGFYVYFGLGFLGAAQLFVYVGGVLVLVLFALMVITRDEAGRLDLGRRFDISALTIAVGLFVLLVASLRDLVPASVPAASTSVAALGATLLGPQLAAFELLGVLLLAALVAVVAIAGGGERR